MYSNKRRENGHYCLILVSLQALNSLLVGISRRVWHSENKVGLGELLAAEGPSPDFDWPFVFLEGWSLVLRFRFRSFLAASSGSFPREAKGDERIRRSVIDALLRPASSADRGAVWPRASTRVLLAGAVHQDLLKMV